MVCGGRLMECVNGRILVVVILLAAFVVALVVQLNMAGIFGSVGLANFSVGGSHDRHGNFVNNKAVVDYDSCLSRNESSSFLYRKEYPESNKSNPKPSAYLQWKLWKYEALHERCAPHTRAFNNSIFAGKEEEKEDGDCKYLVWVASSGLGNRMLSLTSCFLYALLTGRVLLVSSGDNDMAELFCEPFPKGTWVLPSGFPLFNDNRDFHNASPHRYGNFMKNMNSSQAPAPLFVYQHMEHDYQVQDRSFFCEEDQLFLRRFPWVVVKSNLYFVPSMFLTPSFQDELNLLFPRKDGVFQLLSRYLLHPSNEVWGMVKRYYEAHLKQADERIGLQIRKLHSKLVPSDDLLNKITSCMSQEKILPELQKQGSNNITATWRHGNNKTLLVASLISWYTEMLKSRYLMNPNVNGDTISVQQPSHEEEQQTHLHSHNIKALADIYLLSSTDKLVTTAYSTFGYVPRALGGVVESWVLTRGWSANRPTSPPCRKVASTEPCHLSPPNFDCKARREKLGGEIDPYIRPCVDTDPGAGYTLVAADHNRN